MCSDTSNCGNIWRCFIWPIYRTWFAGFQTGFVLDDFRFKFFQELFEKWHATVSSNLHQNKPISNMAPDMNIPNCSFGCNVIGMANWICKSKNFEFKVQMRSDVFKLNSNLHNRRDPNLEHLHINVHSL